MNFLFADSSLEGLHTVRFTGTLVKITQPEQKNRLFLG